VGPGAGPGGPEALLAVIRLAFEAGTLVVQGCAEVPCEGFVADPRAGGLRAPAHRYRALVEALRREGTPYDDQARSFAPLTGLRPPLRQPFPHQVTALAAWEQHGRRGVVELPTGAGKTTLALFAIARTARPTLVVVPTIELLGQWQRELRDQLGIEAGLLGGGARELRDVTVSTYDSAALQIEFLGARYGLVIFDEVHHLPAPSYRVIAEGSLAPFRLGLTATLARQDGGEAIVERLVGPVVHRTAIGELQGRFLAPYEVKQVEVALEPDEQQAYDAARGEWLTFLRGSGISLSEPGGFARLLALGARSQEGRSALAAYRLQRRLAFSSRGKLRALFEVLLAHRPQPALVFTDDNETVYALSHQLLLPALTHRTLPLERRRLLGELADGKLAALLTSRVLNEGVDVPEIEVGVVLSGSGSPREHVQRLGRILRHRPGKRATLYEITTRGTAEGRVSERRRAHAAYGGA